MSAQKVVAPHLRKKGEVKKNVNTATPAASAANTAKPTAPNLNALQSIARAANAVKPTITTDDHDNDNDVPIKTTRITVDPRVLSNTAADHDAGDDHTIEAAHTTYLNDSSSNADARPSLQSTPANAVVLYGIQQTLSPMEMIQHETVRTLQSLLDNARAQLKAANARCDQLNAENADLRRRISEGTQDEEQHDTSAMLGETLVGYESSEVAEEETISDGKHRRFSLAPTAILTIDRLIGTSSAISSPEA